VAVLVGIAFVAGLVSGISPCILPVLPIVLAGSATGSRRKPYAIVAGLVASFTAFTLAATALLSALGLPGDFLRNVAIGVVLAVALGLVWPRLGRLLERPFASLGRSRPSDTAGGFVLGVSLGLLYTPCAGPIIAAVATVAATRSFSAEAVFVTLAYALGHGLVLLAIAVAARRGLSLAPLRARATAIRQALGVLVAAVAVVMVLGLDARLAANVPGYTRALQGLEESATAATRLDELVGSEAPKARETSDLEDFGRAPDFAGIGLWLNSEPLTLEQLRGKVLLLDFWTYSCVNCLRTLPYLTRWYETYRDSGFTIIGVHTPEFAFEREPANVRRAVEDLGIKYPVALDNGYETWNAWGNRYWPAEYFIDRRGHVRFAHFGEGAYEEKEAVIRELLAEEGLSPPVSGSIDDQTPTAPQTPETYLGYARVDRLAGSPVYPDEEHVYELPDFLPDHAVAFGGRWTIGEERAVAGAGARLRLNYLGGRVFLVLGKPGEPGTVDVSLNGRRLATIAVVEHRLYDIASTPAERKGELNLLELSFSPGIEAYAFTFGS
jgi:cytochrome c biogenesis protein CcdA/thiol-disulfide isomerase/thioredoxin